MTKLTRLTRPMAGGLAALMLLTSSAYGLTVEDAQALVEEHYISSIPSDVYEQTTVEDLFTALGDPYSLYMTAEEYSAFLAAFEDTLVVGIGVSSTITTEGALVNIVYDDSPAQEGGLAPNDLIIAVDGTSIVGADSITITNLLRGEDGTQVEVTYLRDGSSYTITLTRAEVNVPNTTYDLIDGHIGYIDCTTFGEDTVTHFDEALDAYGYADRWIVNLMSNGGGYATYATEALSYFTGTAYAGYLKNAVGQYGVYAVQEDSATLSPVIVLTDAATASASELYAAAISDLNAGIVVGWRTYGKGLAQILIDEDTYPEYFDGDAVKISTYQFYSAGGNTTNTVGVIPHVMVLPDVAEDVAVLLSSSNPSNGTDGYLRIDLNWRWNVDLEQATSEEYIEAFSALISALPASANVWLGTGGGDGWEAITAEEVVALYDLDYVDRSFTDTADSPYADAIDQLATYYMISGDEDGNFNPTDTLTRGELCFMLAQALGCNVPTGDSLFEDVDMDSTYGAAINAMALMGLVNGTDETHFSPDAAVTQQELITILGRTAEYLNMGLDSTLDTCTEETLADESLSGYSDWAKEYVWLLSQSQANVFGTVINYLWDDADAIEASAAATKEQSAYLLYQVLVKTGVMPF